MTFESEFEDAAGWSVVDTNARLDAPAAEPFLDFLKENAVDTVIRYYASTRRAKTMTKKEAKFLSAAGFNLVPVYQDRHRDLKKDFGSENGRRSAEHALKFADHIGQPDGSALFFAVDLDIGARKTKQIDSWIAPFFEAINAAIGGRFRIGAYGGGAVLKRLLDKELIDLAWLSMRAGHHGTEDFFRSGLWALRQVPPAETHPGSGVVYHRNALGWELGRLGAFRLSGAGAGALVGGAAQEDAVLGGARVALDGPDAGAPAYASTDGVNFRAAPMGEILRELTIGEPLLDLGAADAEGWRRVALGGARGVVHRRYLRAPRAPEVETLLARAIEEWLRFDKGRGDAASAPYCGYVGDMWELLGLPHDGRSRGPSGEPIPWSAAFVSFVVARAGPAYRGFKASGMHSVFVHDAIRARFLDLGDRPFWGYRPSERRPEIGDIVQRNLGPRRYSFDVAERNSDYASHSDIVVEVTSHVARAIGGDPGDEARDMDDTGGVVREYALYDDGLLAAGQGVISLLKNRAGQVEID